MRSVGLRVVVCVFLLLLVTSCKIVQERPSFPLSKARVLVYIHTDSFFPPDIDFTISKIVLGSERGDALVFEGSKRISSMEVAKRQVFVAEGFVEPGDYNRLVVTLESVSIRRGEGRSSLRLDREDIEFNLKHLRLARSESTVLQIGWNPEKSIKKRIIFSPAFNVELERPSARELLLFVSNSGANYISVIDRSLERIIGAVTVGLYPTAMAINETGDFLYVLNAGSNTISIVDTAHMRVRDTINIDVGIEPRDMAFMPSAKNSLEGKLYVTNRLYNNVIVVDTFTRRVIKSIDVGLAPSYILADPDRKEVYVTAEDTNELTIVDTVDDSVADTVKVDSRPTGITRYNDKLYVFCEGGSIIEVISQTDRKVTNEITLTEPPTRGLKGFGGRMFVVSRREGMITFFSSADVITRILRLDGEPVELATDETRNRLYITDYRDGELIFIDPIGEVIVKEIVVGSKPYWVVQLDK